MAVSAMCLFFKDENTSLCFLNIFGACAFGLNSEDAHIHIHPADGPCLQY